LLRRTRRDPRHLTGELAALSDGGCVGAVVRKGSFEHIPGAVEVGLVGDDEKQVLFAAAGGGYVEAPVRGRGGDYGEADINRVALAAVCRVGRFGEEERDGRP
jgi:hypothetical protein